MVNQLKQEIQPSPEQVAAYNIGPDDTVYQINPYILRDGDLGGYQTSSSPSVINL